VLYQGGGRFWPVTQAISTTNPTTAAVIPIAMTVYQSNGPSTVEGWRLDAARFDIGSLGVELLGDAPNLSRDFRCLFRDFEQLCRAIRRKATVCRSSFDRGSFTRARRLSEHRRAVANLCWSDPKPENKVQRRDRVDPVGT
jgi:hypothetical protein